MDSKIELARCDAEIAEIDSRDANDPQARAHLSVLGLNDWRHEKRLIEQETQAGTP